MYSQLSKYLVWFAICFLLPSYSWADTHSAADEGDGTCAVANVAAAVAKANVAGGDIVTIPAGECPWATALTIDRPLTLQGNGATGVNKTKITVDAGLNTGAILVTPNTSALVRITGIYIDLVTTTNTDRVGIKATGTMTQFQVDNNIFNGGKYQLWKLAEIYGVVFKNTFQNATTSIAVEGGNDTSWGLDLTLAGNDKGLNTFYIEGNTFVRNADLACQSLQNHIESSQGGSFVLRYNDFTGTEWCAGATECGQGAGVNCYSDYHFMTHGNGRCYADGVMRGHPLTEVYNNKASSLRGSNWTFRGGSVIMHDNEITTTVYTPVIVLREEEAEGGSPFNPCSKTAWPAEDQIFNSFIYNNTVNSAAATITITPLNTGCTVSSTGTFTSDPTNEGNGYAYDSAAGWTNDLHNGRILFITSGTANGKRYPIDDTIAASNAVKIAGLGSPNMYSDGVRSGDSYAIRNYACCTDIGEGTCDTFIVENQDYFTHAPADTGGKETVYSNGTTKFTFSDATHKMSFSPEGANAYYPYTTFTCPHPLTGLTGTCDPDKAGAGGDAYNIPEAGQFTVTASAGSNGSLSCVSPVDSGDTTTCTATPNANYRTLSISGCGGTWTTGNSYTTGAITEDCTVTATFNPTFGQVTVGTEAAGEGKLVPGSGGSLVLQ